MIRIKEHEKRKFFIVHIQMPRNGWSRSKPILEEYARR